MGVGGLGHAPAAVPLDMTRYLLYRMLGGPQAGLDRFRKSPSPGIRYPDCLARSESPYQLRYAGPRIYYKE
jgi:hypothetical protein